MNKKLIVLGSTGSIGTQALQVAEHLGCEVTAIAAGSNATLLAEQARRFRPRTVVLADYSGYAALKAELADTAVTVQAGAEAVAALASMPGEELVLNAVTGIAGLDATLAALTAGRTLALANKESLVAAGKLVMETARRSGSVILPVDSEHSAIFQCLNGESGDRIRKVLLTASGGPFFGRSKNELEGVTAAEALRHPNWSMGRKITIDSATMMNKGLELIEAMWLFDLPSERIEILIHRQSVVHSAVEFCDGAVMAQLGVPDMRIPIQYAVTYPDRAPSQTVPLSLFESGSLTFERPDPETFRCLAAARFAAKAGGLAPCVLNGANEAAVALFLENRISFLDIGRLVEEVLARVNPPDDGSIAAVREADRMAREAVASLAGRV